MTLTEKSSLVSTFTNYGFYSACSADVSANIDIFLHYVTIEDMLRQQLQPNNWRSIILDNKYE